MNPSHPHRSGMVAVVGRPNVGKSTLVNALVGQKVSITSPKPQTTRHRILGISTKEDCQAVYIDTPGLHRSKGRALGRYLNRSACSAMQEVQLIMVVVQALAWTSEDQSVCEQVRNVEVPTLYVINKVDLVEDKTLLLPFMRRLVERSDIEQLWPVSALSRDGLTALESALCQLLPESPAMFPSEMVTDRNLRFMVAELIREQLTLRLRDELPYRLSVELERFEVGQGLARIDAVIWVETTGQRRIVIGGNGAMLKAVGTAARREIETMVEQRVSLQLWVKVLEGWSDNEAALNRLGYRN